MRYAIILLMALGLYGCGDNMETVVLETSMGNIEIELDRANAPVTVENFVQYVNSG